jgi:hypothetical protein
MDPESPDGTQSLPLDRKRQIDDQCEQFEDQWRAWRSEMQDAAPRIDAYLEQWEEPIRQQLFRELLQIDLSYRTRHGLEAELTDYAGRFADYITVVKQLFAARVPASKASGGSSGGLAVTRSADMAQSMAGQRIGKYEVLETLGGGGQAMTYLVVDPDLKRRVVIKQYHASGTPLERQAVLNEGQALARVHSRYVAQCLNVERQGDEIYLVMEYIRGEDLATTAQRQPLDPRAATSRSNGCGPRSVNCTPTRCSPPARRGCCRSSAPPVVASRPWPRLDCWPSSSGDRFPAASTPAPSC